MIECHSPWNDFSRIESQLWKYWVIVLLANFILAAFYPKIFLPISLKSDSPCACCFSFSCSFSSSTNFLAYWVRGPKPICHKKCNKVAAMVKLDESGSGSGLNTQYLMLDMLCDIQIFQVRILVNNDRIVNYTGPRSQLVDTILFYLRRLTDTFLIAFL